MIYEVRCGNWSKVNVSQTGRTLRHRLNEHRRALTSTNLIQSALAKHAASHDHAIDWDSAKVINTHPQFQQKCPLESWHIRSQDAILNREEGNLFPVYKQLIV